MYELFDDFLICCANFADFGLMASEARVEEGAKIDLFEDDEEFEIGDGMHLIVEC